MPFKFMRPVITLSLIFSAAETTIAVAPVGTAFAFQGRLTQNGQPQRAPRMP